jgi:EAL domain-containing protein (putative c-di-GMP-specific phosphodiesterase class I)
MDELEKHKMLESARYLREQPDYMQNLFLLWACKSNLSGGNGEMIEKLARKLAEYGVKPEKVFPCITEIMEIFLKE